MLLLIIIEELFVPCMYSEANANEEHLCMQQQLRVTPRVEDELKKSSRGYSLYHQLPINESPVKIG